VDRFCSASDERAQNSLKQQGGKQNTENPPMSEKKRYNPEQKVAVLAYNFFGLYKIEWNYAMAAVLMTLTPAIIFYLALQKYIIKGMVSGEVKA
jgi:hypothetical protein